MSDSRMFTGGCHCGLVRFECTTDLAMVTACNCSICTKKGLHFTFLPPKSFQLRAGEDNLREYLFNKHAIRHQLCADCGVERQLHRRHRTRQACDDADRRTQPVAAAIFLTTGVAERQISSSR